MSHGLKPNGNVVEQSRSKMGKLQREVSTLRVFVSHKTEEYSFVTDEDPRGAAVSSHRRRESC